MATEMLDPTSVQVTAVDGRPGTHVVHVPVDDSGTVIGCLVWVETVSGNTIKRSDPVFVPKLDGDSSLLSRPGSLSAQEAAVEGRAVTSVVRVPLDDVGAFVAWVETTLADGTIVISQPTTAMPAASGGGGGGLSVIEARTSDPSSPVDGQVWLRTDL